MKKLDWKELKYFPKPFKMPPPEKAPYELIGQQRAEEALTFGLQVKSKGYHIYVCGQTGTGRTSFALEYAKKQAKNEKTPPDLCYVYNFENPKCPKLLKLAAGTGKKFKDEMNELISLLSAELPRIFGDKNYDSRKTEIGKSLRLKHDVIIKRISEEAKKYDFEVKQSPHGIFFVPIVKGVSITEEQFEALPPDQRDIIIKKSDAMHVRAAEAMRALKDCEKSSKQEVDEMDYALGLFTVGHHMSDIFESYENEPDLIEYLKAVKEDILENLTDFTSGDSDDEQEPQNLALPWAIKKTSEDNLSKYNINLLTDNSKQEGAPVIVDYYPTYSNLVGEVEYDNEYGNFTTDFMKIKPGLLHKANGGYLVMQAQDVFGSPLAWETLRRTLVTGNIVTEPLREYSTGVAVSGIKPEPIPVDVKIILIGGGFYYDILYAYDDYFEKLFKIRVDFDTEMKLNDANLAEIAKFAGRFSLKEGAMPLEPCALARFVEHATRLAERQDKLTTRFNRLEEILVEAAQWARIDGKQSLTNEYVLKAIKKREARLNMYEEKIQDMIEEDQIMITTEGKKVGQINGLAVLDMQDHVFAKPTRITATAYMGRAGIVNIEKEADMSGAIHDKGIQVLIGYLGQTYAQDFPLSLSCRICFEQNYSGIDGDSASSTELYAVISALTGLPIRQDIGVTGSINQHGEIQPIGGATFKIEGFFDLCKARGLTGSQGVIIPARNIKDLVLKDEVVKAVKEKKFHIYAITHVDEGMEILLDMPAGKHPFPANSVHGMAIKKLRSYHRKAMKGN